MTESFFEELPNLTEDETQSPELADNLSSQADHDDSLLTSLTLVQKIVRRRAASSWQSEAADLMQRVLLRLLTWRRKYTEKSQEMSPDEWQSFTARTAFNEINRYHKKQKSLAEVPIDESSDYARIESPEGNSKAEESSLALAGWQEICTMSLRQRRALLFHSQKLYVHLLKSGVSNEEIAAILEISVDCWMKAKMRIPMSDIKIAELIQTEDQRKCTESKSRSIKKARFEARIKLRKVTDK
jgi:RNA polymerase sigma factor (sigma-70 family)